MLAAETVHLTCAVTPAEPHVFQLGKLHFVLNSNEAASRVDKDHRHLSTHWIMWPVATELMLFLKKLNPSPPIPPPLEPSLFVAHGHMIAADGACPLVFARARVHNVHTREAALGGRVSVKCKGR